MKVRIADNDHRESVPMSPEDYARDAVLMGLPETWCPYAPGTLNCRLFLREFRALSFAKQAIADGRIASAEQVLDAANNAEAERAEASFPDRLQRGEVCAGGKSIWAWIGAWVCGKPRIGDE